MHMVGIGDAEAEAEAEAEAIPHMVTAWRCR